MKIYILLLMCLSVSVQAQSRNFIPLEIQARDGATLAADLYAMDTVSPKPVVLIQTPYNKLFYRLAVNLPEAGGMLPFDTVNYNYVTTDWRGYYASSAAAKPGYDRGLDGYDAVEWIAKQKWCNGKVGTWGGSALGYIQFLTAKHHPPHLLCSAPFIMDYKTTYEKYFPGGCYLEEHYNRMDSIGFPGTDIVKDHPKYDLYWKVVENLTDLTDSIAVPILMMTGWYDHFPDGVIRAFDDLRKRSHISVREKHKFIIGPWLHTEIGKSEQGVLEYTEAVDIVSDVSSDFFDYYLRDIQNGYEEQPVLRYFDLGDHSMSSADDSWQNQTANGDTLKLFLAPSAQLSNTQLLENASETYIYDPRDFSPSIGSSTFSTYLKHGPQDISSSIEQRNDVLTYTTATLTSPIVVRGKIQVQLFVQTDRTDTDFGVRLCDVYPDGRSIIITDAMKRLRFRGGFESEALAIPFQTYSLTVDLRNLAITFPVGHRLRIDITSSNYPRFNRNPNSGAELYSATDTLTARNSVCFGGSTASVVNIPIPKNLSVSTVTVGSTLMCPTVASGELLIQLTSSDEGVLTLTNSLGVIVKRIVIPAHLPSRTEYKIDIHDISQGVYLVSHKTKTSSSVRKVVINE